MIDSTGKSNKVREVKLVVIEGSDATDLGTNYETFRLTMLEQVFLTAFSVGDLKIAILYFD
jgi:hypothetical protein